MPRMPMLAAVVTALSVLGVVNSIAGTNSRLATVDDMGVDASLLAEHRIEPTQKGVTDFLHHLKTELEEVKKAEELVPQLGDKRFRVREAAVRRLIEGPSLPLKALQQATTAADPEIASRARQILSDPLVAVTVARAERLPWVSAAVFRTIQKKPLRGTARALLDVLPLLDDSDLLDGACEAVAGSATADDAPLLRQSLASSKLNLRIAAIRGLSRADGKAEVDLRPFLEDTELRLTLAAAHTLAERGDRSALAALVRLASSTNEQVRVRSEQILRAWTGRNVGFNPFQDPATQKESLARWRSWVDAEGRSARLNHPLRLEPLPEDLRRGLLLHYAFEEITEGRLSDSSEHRRHGALHNEHSRVPGVAGKALEVRGKGDMGDQGGHASLPFIDFMEVEQFTVALWVYERGMTSDFGEAYVVFGADRGVGVEDSLGISHFNNDIFYRVGGAVVHSRFEPTDRNRWVHYALTFQHGHLLAYKDGRRVGEARGKVVVVGKQAALGRHWWGHGVSTSTRFIGAFDELRVYQRALSPSQIELLHALSQRKTGSRKTDPRGPQGQAGPN